jgi:hypothetical protein
MKTLNEVLESLISTTDLPAFSQVVFKTKEGDLEVLVDVCNERIMKSVYRAHYFCSQLSLVQHRKHKFDNSVNFEQEVQRLNEACLVELNHAIREIEKSEND